MAASPTFGGRLISVDEAKAKVVPGVTQVVRLDDAVGALTPFESVSGTQMAVQLPMQRTVPFFSWSGL